jgi:hypothetical protein
MNDWRCILPAALGLALIGCDTMSGPIGSSSFDPLVPPGSETSPPVVAAGGGFRPGQITAVSMDNAAFFNQLPRGSSDPNELLRAGTQVKVVAIEGSYLKVELDSGKVGYLPAMMVTDPAAKPSPNEVQVYPPLPGTQTVPIIPLEPANPNDPQAPSPEELPSMIEPDGTAENPPPPPPVPGDLKTPAPPIKPNTTDAPQPPPSDSNH